MLLGGALRRFKPSEILGYLVVARHAARAGRPVALTREELGALTGLSRNTVAAALQALLTHGLLRARTAPDSLTTGYEAVCPSAAGCSGLGPGGGEVGTAEAFHLELAPVEAVLQPEDRATFQSITTGFAPADHVAYREDALVWLRRHVPGRTPDEATIAAVRDRLLLLEHVGPSRLARYRSELDGFHSQR